MDPDPVLAAYNAGPGAVAACNCVPPYPETWAHVARIREGKHQELEVAMKDLAAFVEGSMTRVISYGFFLNQDQTQMTVVAVHPDSESLEFHMDTGAAEFRKFADFIPTAPASTTIPFNE